MINHLNIISELEDFSAYSISDDECWFKLNELVNQVHVPELTITEFRPFEWEDFLYLTDVAKICFQTLQNVLSASDVEQFDKNDNFFKLIYSSIILCGEHSNSFLWTDDDCLVLSQNLLNIILKSVSCENIESFLLERNRENKCHGVLLLSQILPKLSKESWKYYPATVQCFSWLVLQIKIPNMKHFIQNILPVCLNILDDYEVDNKIIALNCLCHLISNVSKAELCWNIELEVICKIIKPLFYYKEAELILPLTNCALEIADKSQLRFKDAGVELKWSFLDEILSVILPMMEYEQDMRRRFSYSQSLCIILERSDFAVGRWSSRILQIVEDYAKISTTELEAMKALNLFVKKCWPLVKFHWKFINLICGRILYRSNNNYAILEAKLTINMLKKLLPEEREIVDVEYIEQKRKQLKVS